MQEQIFNIGDKVVLKKGAIIQFVKRLKVTFPFIDLSYYELIASGIFTVKEKVVMEHPVKKVLVNMYKLSCYDIHKLKINEDVFKYILETLPKCSFEETIISKTKITYIPEWKEYISSNGD